MRPPIPESVCSQSSDVRHLWSSPNQFCRSRMKSGTASSARRYSVSGNPSRQAFARLTYWRARFPARVEGARRAHEFGDLLGANALKTALGKNSRHQPPPVAIRVAIAVGRSRMRGRTRLKRKNQRQRDLAFLQITQHRLAELFRRSGEIEQDRPQAETRGRRCGHIRPSTLRYAWAAGRAPRPGARIR